MKPKKDLIKVAEADGSIDRLNSLLSAAHILNCEANMLVEEAADLMNAKGLLLGNLKGFITALSRAPTCTSWNSPHS